MSNFERENRYMVIKRSDLETIPNRQVVNAFLASLAEVSAHSCRIPQRQFLVIESDWPEYEPVWQMLEARVTGAEPAHRACGKCGKPTACGKMICEECCYEPLPVPPAGGKPDPIISVLKGNLAEGIEPKFSGGDLKHLIALLETGTRLQAEVERLKQVAIDRKNELTKLCTERNELQAELTKARELLSKVRLDYKMDICRQLWNEIGNYLSNQSAPADKGQGAPVAWIDWSGGDCPVDTDAVVEYAMACNPQQVCGPEAACRLDWRHNQSPTKRKPNIVKYRAIAKPPAPVAVVMPKLEMADVVKAHMEIPGCPVLTSNQCHALAMNLNARLNSEQKP